MKKADIITVVCFLSAALIIFGVISAFKKQGETVVIKKNNTVVYEGSLYTDKKIELDGNTAVIKNGYAYMESAKCKNQICVHTNKISSKGETVICLPNKVIIEIK